MKRRIIYLLIIFILIFCNCSYVFADELDLVSSNAGVFRADNLNVLYNKNIDEKISFASITKLMTAVVAIENIEDVNQILKIDYDVTEGLIDPDLVTAGIYRCENMNYYDLLATMLVKSGADSAVYLACTIFEDYDTFIMKMNEKAKELGMNNTSFANPTGLDDENNYSTISDLAILMQYVLKNDVLREIISLDTYTTSDGLITVKSTFMSNKNQYIKGGKTGTTGDAGLCLCSYSVDDVELIAIVTGSSMYSTSKYNIIESEKLYKYISEKYNNIVVLNEGENVLKLNTIYAKEDNITYNVPENVYWYLDEVDKSKISYHYDGVTDVKYNTEVGTKLGTLDIYYEKDKIYSMDIVLENELKFSLTKWSRLHVKEISIVSAGVVFVILCIILILKGKRKTKSGSYTVKEK